jgi:hypothetical protein
MAVSILGLEEEGAQGVAVADHISHNRNDIVWDD